ncbi:Nn.00g104890.m01.CDS01 [Neocucurbitaria sp. VM-36]
MDMQNDPAFWELFGPKAVPNLLDVKQTFEDLVNRQDTISVSCNLDDTDPACTDWHRYGGVGQVVDQTDSTNSSPSLVFCREFFSFPPLDYRVNMGINHPTNWTARFDLGFYHENQGTALLRAVLPLVSGSGESSSAGSISDLWVYVQHTDTVRWTACYGVLCSKLLARLSDTSWSLHNADNYALFALSKYVSQVIEGSFPWLPRLDRNEEWSPLIIQPPSGVNGKPFTLTEKFSDKSVSQPSYNRSRYQPNVTFSEPPEVLGESAVDLTKTSWLQTDDSFSAGWIKQRNDFLDELKYAWGNGSLDMDTKRTLTCFKNGTTTHDTYGLHDIQPFNVTQGADAAVFFCERFRNWTFKPVYPTVHNITETALIQDSILDYESGNKTNAMNFLWLPDPDSFLVERPMRSLFEGVTDADRVRHCHMTYKFIMNECDKGRPDGYGGIVKLNDRIYAALALPSSHNITRQEITPVNNFKCTEYNATSYWRTADAIHSMQDPKLSKLCTCWYDDHTFAAQMFCKPTTGDCASLRTDENIVSTKGKDFNCS